MVRIAFEARLGSVILLYMLMLCDRVISLGFFYCFSSFTPFSVLAWRACSECERSCLLLR